MEVLNIGQELILEALQIDSLNTGINTGPNSGGSISSHLHIHIVPRKNNDLNFMNTIIHTPISIRNYNQYDTVREKILKKADKLKNAE